MRKIFGVILLCSLVAEADTVTTRDSRSWNGTIQTMQNGILTLSAAFPGMTSQLPFGLTTLRAIEFNSTTFNPGSSPGLATPASASLSGTVYPKPPGSTGTPCKNIAIDLNNVTCDKLSWPRQNVVRILFDDPPPPK